ncbi:MAG: YqaA family protein [Burkholderiaceae bacterium]
MEAFLMDGIHWMLGWLSLPAIGLPAIFVISLVSATLLPLGSEPVVFGYVSVAPTMFWPAVLVATAGNTIGGAISYWMGLAAQRAVARWKVTHGDGRVVDDATQAQALPGIHPQPAAPTGVAAPAAPAAAPLPAPGERAGGRWHAFSSRWLTRLGPAALLFSWMPVVGDPLCAVAGYLRLPFWPCVAYMAVGKFARYALMTSLLLWGYTFVSG